MTLYLRVAGSWCGVGNLQAQRAPGNWCEVMTVKSKGQSWNFTMCKSPTIDTLKKVFKNLWQKLHIAEEAPVLRLEDQRNDLGIIYVDNDESRCSSWTKLQGKMQVYRNTNFEELKNLSDITQRLILEHEAEIMYVSPIDWTAPSWTRSTLTRDQVTKWAKAKVHVTQRFSRGHWTFPGPTDEKKWYGTLNYTPEGDGGTFQRTGHPVFKGISALSRGLLQRKGGRCIIHLMRIHRTQNFCFAQFTQQINSVSTEQSQAGVKSSVNGLHIKKSRLWRSSMQKRASNYWREVNTVVQTPRSDDQNIWRKSSEI